MSAIVGLGKTVLFAVIVLGVIWCGLTLCPVGQIAVGGAFSTGPDTVMQFQLQAGQFQIKEQVGPPPVRPKGHKGNTQDG